MNDFTPIPALIGGALIGLSASLLLLTHGRIAGISGMLGGLLAGDSGKGIRIAFLGGLVTAGVIVGMAMPTAFPRMPVVPIWMTAIAGLLVGFGTRFGGGCTSGHGVCGMSRFSIRSVVGTITFMATGIATVFVIRHVLGWAS